MPSLKELPKSMNSSFAVRGPLTAVAFLAAAAMFLLVLGSTPAGAAEPSVTYSGNATFTIGTGKAGKALNGKVKAIAPAKAKRQGRKTHVNAPVRNFNGDVTLKGGIRFQSGKRKVNFTGLTVKAGRNKTVVRGKVAGRTITAFKVAGKSVASGDTANGSIRIVNGKLSLSGTAIRAVKKGLKLKKVPGGQAGLFSLFAEVKTSGPIDPCSVDPQGASCPIVDPYLVECGVPATSRVAPTRPAATALPTLTGARAITGPATFDWGFRTAFRGYLYGTNIGDPTANPFFALGGATRAAGGSPTRGFTFPAGSGQYLAGDPVDMTDDKAIINGTGTTVYCNKAHAFWFSIANPTIVIDGENSRIVADVASNETGVWTTTQRVDLADLDLTGITPFYNKSGSEVSWGDVPATLTTAVAPFATYDAGEALDAINVSVKTAYDTSDFNALANYVSTELPFPLPDDTLGGCSIPTPAGGSAVAARTVDEHLSYNGTASAWTTDGSRPAALPVIAGGNAVTGGSFQWGVRRSLRGSVNSSGLFNLFGTTASNTPYFGNGPGSTPRVAQNVPGQMGGSYAANLARFFQWPAATTGSTFEPNDPGIADDKLVLKSTGRLGICQTGADQWYGTVLSDPTVIIDGSNSRIQVEVATRYRLSWVRGRVDVASIDLTDAGVTSGVTSSAGVTTAAWTFPRAVEPTNGDPQTGPIKLTEAGKSVFNMISPAGYVAGTPMDAAIITATYPDPA